MAFCGKGGIMNKCGGCKYLIHINANDNWGFFGCIFPPLRGKWIREIEQCPKEVIETEKDEKE